LSGCSPASCSYLLSSKELVLNRKTVQKSETNLLMNSTILFVCVCVCVCVPLKVDAARKALAAKPGQRKPAMDSLPASVAGLLAVPTTLDVDGEGLDLTGEGGGKDSKKKSSSKKNKKNKNKK
jgi:hypothetical protein